MTWSGQYENMLRVKERLKLIIPLTLVLIFGLLYMNTKSSFKAALVMLAVPFSAIGAVWLLWALDYNISIAVWVGIIALMGLDAETGVFMLLFLDLSHDEYKAKGLLRTGGDLVEAIVHGAVKRVRPKAMTVFAAMLGLLPIMWSIGTGADVMKRIAAPMIGGLVDVVPHGAARLPGRVLPVEEEGSRATRTRSPRRRSLRERAAGPGAGAPGSRTRPVVAGCGVVHGTEATEMDVLTSPAGSLAIAISALLLVMGFRLARPVRTREWLAIAAYAGALFAQTLGAVGFLGDAVVAPGTPQRLAGAALLVAGILLAGGPSRARRRAADERPGGTAPDARSFDPVYAGLALILVGQLLRGPSRAGAISVAVGVLIAGWVALTPRRAARAGQGSTR